MPPEPTCKHEASRKGNEGHNKSKGNPGAPVTKAIAKVRGSGAATRPMHPDNPGAVLDAPSAHDFVTSGWSGGEVGQRVRGVL